MSDASVRLTEATVDNYRALLKLPVADEQQGFVAFNAASIAKSKFHPHYVCSAICRGDEPVGFLMYGPDEVDDRSRGVMIFRLTVDRRWQREGIGREAMSRAIEEIKESRVERIAISYEPENVVAKRLYAGFGFVEVGEDDGEIIAELR